MFVKGNSRWKRKAQKLSGKCKTFLGSRIPGSRTFSASGVQCDQISEATGIQRAAAGGVDEEVKVDHVGVQCVQGHNGLQVSHVRGSITKKWLMFGRFPNL